MPEITRRGFMTLLAATGVAVHASVQASPQGTARSSSSPKSELPPSKAAFSWTPDGGNPIPLKMTSVSQSIRTQRVESVDETDLNAEIEVETPHFWDCDITQRGTMRFTVDGRPISVMADVCSCEREIGQFGSRQRTTLICKKLMPDDDQNRS